MAEKVATRSAYGEALAEIGSNPRIIALDADLSCCTMSCFFGQKYPKRFHNMGIAEANMVGVAAGLAYAGYIPFVHSFAMFLAGRAYEQIRNSVAYPNLNVRLVGTHGGLSVGEDGATHQCLEDIALMRAVPNMCVICPADAKETDRAVKAIADYDKGPVYLRLGRLPVESVTETDDYRYKIGKAAYLRKGNDATIIATGLMVQEAVRAADMLLKDEIHVRVLDMHTIKPIDRDAILCAAEETPFILTAEEHSVIGGLGSAVCGVLSQNKAVKTFCLGVNDKFGHSGAAALLLEEYGLTAGHMRSIILSELKR